MIGNSHGSNRFAYRTFQLFLEIGTESILKRLVGASPHLQSAMRPEDLQIDWRVVVSSYGASILVAHGIL
jgi:hypothetical protein